MKRFVEELGTSWQKYFEEYERLYEKAFKMIKHPHFQYALIDSHKHIKIKLKPFWRWFSTSREVRVRCKTLY